MFKKVLISSVVLVAAAGAYAQSSASLSMTGSLTPVSCSITLTGGGVANYGTNETTAVRAASQTGTTNLHYSMGAKTIPLDVTCTAATPLQLAFNDSKAGKALAFNSSSDALRFGLVDGASGTAAIGSYVMSFSSITIDGVASAGSLVATTGSTTWTASNAVYAAPGKATGFIKTAGLTAPSAITTIRGSLIVDTAIGKTYVDTAKSAITLNGGGTITLQYL
jgi:Protein of unknown function (DUF1120)